MTIKTWSASQFSKRKNSTKQPTTSGTSHTVRLKEGTSIITPTIIFSGHLDPSDICYAQIADFDRYYFKTDFRYVGPETEIDFRSDTMGSFKTDIGSVNAHVLRCSNSTGYDLSYTDPLNPPNTGISFYHGAETIKFGNVAVFDLNNVSFLLTLISESSGGGNGFAVTYMLNGAGIRSLADQFVDPTFIQNLKQEFTNPMDLIISCKRVPISATNIVWSGTSETINIGHYSTGVTGLRLQTNPVLIGMSINNPSSALYYMKAAPYSTYILYLPFVGPVSLDYQNLTRGYVAFDVMLDLINGDILYTIKDAGDKVVGTYSGSFASDVPLSASNFSSSGVIGGIVSVIGGVAGVAATIATGGAAGAILGGAAAFVGGAGATAHSLEQHSMINGKLSSALGVKAGLDVEITALVRQARPVLDHSDSEGAVSNKELQPVFIPGYIQYYNARLATCAATEEERTEIETFMNSGFFYE